MVRDMFVLAGLLLLAGPAVACDGQRLEVESGTVKFTVTQGDSPFSGEFRDFGGMVCRKDGAVTHIDVWLDPASVDSGLPEVDELLLSPAFFRVAEHPRVTFTSERVERQGMLLETRGAMEINGISRDRSVEFRFGEKAEGRWIARGRFTVQRLQHDLGTGEWENTDYLADEVVVEFDATLEPAEPE